MLNMTTFAVFRLSFMLVLQIEDDNYFFFNIFERQNPIKLINPLYVRDINTQLWMRQACPFNSIVF